MVKAIVSAAVNWLVSLLPIAIPFTNLVLADVGANCPKATLNKHNNPIKYFIYY
jgi:hypothetical protein